MLVLQDVLAPHSSRLVTGRRYTCAGWQRVNSCAAGCTGCAHVGMWTALCTATTPVLALLPPPSDDTGPPACPLLPRANKPLVALYTSSASQNTYMLNTTAADQYAAEDACVQWGAHLVSYTSKEEQNEVGAGGQQGLAHGIHRIDLQQSGTCMAVA